MTSSWKIRGFALIALAIVAGVVLGLNLAQRDAAAQPPKDSAHPRYAVVHTEGTNIIVTDNKTNTVYYYTTDQGAEPGSELKLRGSLDLSQVGEPVIKPKLFKKEK